MRTLVEEATNCNDYGCPGNKARGVRAGTCPVKHAPYGPPARKASPAKKAVHAKVTAMVVAVREALTRLETAVAYEGTDYGEMLGDLREMRDKIGRHLEEAIAYVRPLDEAQDKAEAARRKRKRVAQGLESPCEKEGA